MRVTGMVASIRIHSLASRFRRRRKVLGWKERGRRRRNRDKDQTISHADALRLQAPSQCPGMEAEGGVGIEAGWDRSRGQEEEKQEEGQDKFP